MTDFLVKNINAYSLGTADRFLAEKRITGLAGPLTGDEEPKEKSKEDSKKGLIVPIAVIGVLSVILGLVYWLVRRGKGRDGDKGTKGDVKTAPTVEAKTRSDNFPLNKRIFQFPYVGDALRSGITPEEWKILMRDVVEVSFYGDEEKAKQAMMIQGIEFDELLYSSQKRSFNGAYLKEAVSFPAGFLMSDEISQCFSTLWAIKEAGGKLSESNAGEASDLFIKIAEAYGAVEFAFAEERSAIEELVARCAFQLNNGSPLMHEYAFIAHIIECLNQVQMTHAMTVLQDTLRAGLDGAKGKASWLVGDAIYDVGSFSGPLADNGRTFICGLLGAIQAKFLNDAATDGTLSNKVKADLLYRAKKQSSMAELVMKTLDVQGLAIPDSVVSYSSTINKRVHNAFLSVARFAQPPLIRT